MNDHHAGSAHFIQGFDAAEAIYVAETEAALRAALMHRARELLDAEVVIILQYNERAKTLTQIAASGLPESFDKAGAYQLALGEGYSGWVGQTHNPLLVDQAESDPRFLDQVKRERVFKYALISVPILVNGRLRQVLTVGNHTQREAFSMDDLRLVSRLAEAGGTRLALFEQHERQIQVLQDEKASLEKTQNYMGRASHLLEKKLLDMTIVNKAYAALPQGLDLDEIAASLLAFLWDLTGYQVGALAAVDHVAGNRLVLNVRESAGEPFVEDFQSRVLHSIQEEVPNYEITEDMRALILDAPLTGKNDAVQSYVFLPLVMEGVFLGGIAVAHARPDVFSGQTQDALDAVAAHATIILDNAILHRRVKMASITDGLTALFTHGYFQQVLDEEFLRARRYHTQFSVILVDLDDFKQFNDNFGHLAGDKILKEAGQCLRAVVRDADVVCRYGGDEFAVLLPETPMAGAMITAQRICRIFHDHRIVVNESPIQVTVSVGVAAYPESGQTKVKLFQNADSALYNAKQQGKNRVGIANPKEDA